MEGIHLTVNKVLGLSSCLSAGDDVDFVVGPTMDLERDCAMWESCGRG